MNFQSGLKTLQDHGSCTIYELPKVGTNFSIFRHQFSLLNWHKENLILCNKTWPTVLQLLNYVFLYFIGISFFIFSNKIPLVAQKQSTVGLEFMLQGRILTSSWKVLLSKYQNNVIFIKSNILWWWNFDNGNFSQSTRVLLNVQVLLVITSNSSSYRPKTYSFIYLWVCTYFMKTFDFRPLISQLFRSSLNFPLVTKLTWQKVWIFCF